MKPSDIQNPVASIKSKRDTLAIERALMSALYKRPQTGIGGVTIKNIAKEMYLDLINNGTIKANGND